MNLLCDVARRYAHHGGDVGRFHSLEVHEQDISVDGLESPHEYPQPVEHRRLIEKLRAFELIRHRGQFLETHQLRQTRAFVSKHVSRSRIVGNAIHPGSPSEH